VRLVHYADHPVGALKEVPPGLEYDFKPSGLWVSDDDCEDNWRQWCLGESFRLEHLTHVHDVMLAPDANVLILRSASDIDGFTQRFRHMDGRVYPGLYVLPWPKIMSLWDGLIITPYIRERRLEDESAWYYTWDCAGGCLWHSRAVAAIALREIVPVPEPV
jgi:hypothetical protein